MSMPRGVTVTWRLAAEFAALQAGGRRRSFAPESPGMARPVRLAVGACVAHALPLPLPLAYVFCVPCVFCVAWVLFSELRASVIALAMMCVRL